MTWVGKGHQSRPSSFLRISDSASCLTFRKAHYAHSLPTSSVRSVWWQQFPETEDSGFGAGHSSPPYTHSPRIAMGKGALQRRREALGINILKIHRQWVCVLSAEGFSGPATPTYLPGPVAAAPSAPPGSSMKVPRVCTPTAVSTPGLPAPAPAPAALRAPVLSPRRHRKCMSACAPPPTGGRASCSCLPGPSTLLTALCAGSLSGAWARGSLMPL